MFGFDYAENPEAWHNSLRLLAEEVLPRVAHLVPRRDGGRGIGHAAAPPGVVGAAAQGEDKAFSLCERRWVGGLLLELRTVRFLRSICRICGST